MASSISRIERSYETQITQIERLSVAINQLDTQGVVREVGTLVDKVDELVTRLGRLDTSSDQSMKRMVGAAQRAGKSVVSLSSKLKEVATVAKKTGESSAGMGELDKALKDAVKVSSEFISSGG